MFLLEPTLHADDPCNLSIELEALLRNLVFYFRESGAASYRNTMQRNDDCDQFLIAGIGTQVHDPHTSAQKKWGGNNNEQRGAYSRASGANLIFKRIQIGPQFVARDTGSSLDLQDAKRRNIVPLDDGLQGDPNATRESGRAAHRFHRSL